MPRTFKIEPHCILLSIDPGKTCGFVIKDHLNTFVWQTIPDHDSYIEVLNENCPDVIVCERFLHTHRDKSDYTAVEYIGLTKWYVQRRRIPLFMQTPSYGKSFFDNNKLKKLGLYQPGKPHGMDALRHLMQFRMTNGDFDLELLR